MENANGHRIDYAELIRPDAIHGRLFYDPDIYKEELEKIFGRTWIYVGHESEVPEPGDFITRKIGLQPVIMVRGKDQRVRLFLNRCRHRANTVCLAERGKATGGFRCIYHGWTYSNTGELVGVPYPEGFDPRDFNKADFPLAEVALESYRGFAFGNLNPTEDLATYLGPGARRLIDQAVDLAPDGEIQLRSSALKGLYRGNWKMAMDNSIDGYHAPFLHQSALSLGRGREANWEEVYGAKGNARVHDLGHGHAYFDLSTANRQDGGFFQGLRRRDAGFNGPISLKDQRAHATALARRVGEARAREILEYGEMGPLTLFPTFNLISGEVRILQPSGPCETEVYYYPILLKGAPRSVNVERIRRESFVHGPAGLVTADDVDMFEHAQQAFDARKEEWLILRRGLREEVREEDGTIVGMGHFETGQRAIWRHYRQIMNA